MFRLTNRHQGAYRCALLKLWLLYVYVVFSLYVYVWLPWLRFFRAFPSVVRQMPGYNPQRQGTARTLPHFCVVLCIFCVVLCIFCVVLCIFCVVLCIVCFVSFSVLFVCICVLYYCHRVATQFQLNISYIISCHIISSYHVIYHIYQSYIISCHIIHHIIYYVMSRHVI